MTSSADRSPIARYPHPHHLERPPVWTVQLTPQLDRQLVGGKAFGLSRLLAAGFTVPPAFCITTDAFHLVIQEIARTAADLEELRAQILAMELPPQLLEEIEARVQNIGASHWAVRSSGLDEDSQARSFAGQAKTLLNISGTEAIVRAIREVWASHFGADNLLYRARDQVQTSLPPMAVIVQEMLDPIAAGVLFSINPVTGADDEVVLTSAPGLGQSVVTGEAGESYWLDKDSGYIRRHTTESSPGGHLSEGQLRELAALAREVERTQGQPVDIEWAYTFTPEQPHHPRLFLLQTRPVTTEPDTHELDTVWTNTNVGEALPGVATPMTWSIIHDFSRRGFEQAFGTLGLTVPDDSQLVRSFRGRIYLNLTQFMSIASGLPLFKPERLFSMAGGGGVELVRDVYERRSKTAFFKRLPITIPKIVGAQLSMPLIAPLWGKYFTGKVEEFFDRDLTLIPQKDLIQELKALDRLFDRTGLVMLSVSSNFLMSYVITAEFLRLAAGEEATRHEQELFSGLDVKSAEPGLALLELGRTIRRSLRLRRAITDHKPDEVLEVLWTMAEHQDVADFLAALDDFRKEYGHRAPREAELATPRWREDMTFLFEVLRSFVEAPHLPSSIEVHREQKRALHSAQDILDEKLPRGLNALFKAVVGFTRSNARRREYMRDRVVDALDIYRHFFLECGRRLTKEGALLTPEDVFFLTRDEIEAWLNEPGSARDFPVQVLVRRELYEFFRNQQDPPDTFLLRGSDIVAEEDVPYRFDRHAATQGDAAQSYLELRGLPGSPGSVTGTARVILDPRTEDATLNPGEILVAPYTDVGWTPLFLTASGVVMSLGGPLSHSCIVAREYGIPTVVNAKRATQIIKTGDTITVDGDRGLVFVQKPILPEE